MNQTHKDNHEPVLGHDPERAGSFSCPKSLVVGVTGGIATGKSTVARMLENLGAQRISADEIVHDLLQPGSEVAGEVVSQFGQGILSPGGEIDRAALGDIVFRDAEKRRRLEAIVHPPVMAEIARRIEGFRRSSTGVLVVEVPLLFEVGATHMVDKVLVVSAEQDTQIGRLQKRYNMSQHEAELRIKSQMPIGEKARHADWVITNEGALHSTKMRVIRLWSEVQKSLALRC